MGIAVIAIQLEPAPGRRTLTAAEPEQQPPAPIFMPRHAGTS
jgi:hypothetical protein